METKQTAIEWLAERVGHNSLMSLADYYEILEQAKEKEKEQILIAYDNGWETGSYKPEQYYNETYGK